MVTPEYAPKVTVYVTSHNYGRFIRQAVDSVLAQTMTDFELIIIDDGSTDDSRDIIETYEDRRVIKIYQKNKGLNVTNNVAVRAARGEYVMRLDADDYLDPNALSVMAGVLDRSPDVGMVFPDYYHVDAAGGILELVRRHDFDDVTLHDQPAHGACTMIRRSCLLDLDGYDESFNCQDGYDLWIRFIEKFEVQNVNLPLFYYRQHGASLTKDETRLLSTRAEILRRVSADSASPRAVSAVIPVRGPAVDPASPALRDLGGRALIDWTVTAALEAETVSGVTVTTPDDEIAGHIARVFGRAVRVHRRGAELARQNTYLEETLREAAAWADDGADALAVLNVESPFRTAAAVDAAVHVMRTFQTDVVTGARPENAMFFNHRGGGLVPIRQTVGLRLERDELYREAGSLRLVTMQHLMNGGLLTGGRIGHVVLDPKAALAIHSRYDWWLAEAHAREDTAAPARARKDSA